MRGMQAWPFSPSPRLSTRRTWLLAGTAAVLAGCSSAPVQPPADRRSAAGTRSGGATGSDALQLQAELREALLARTMLVVNTPYTYGGNTPQGGFDCSGLMQYVFQQVGGAATRLPRSTAQWAAATLPVDEARLARGDLVFFNTTGAPFSHMGLYVGGEQFVHAPSSGGTVRKDSLASRYFATRYQGARRVFAA